jgi:para-nitrobenzyl esterase
MSATVVETSYGKLEGLLEGKIHTFRGVPYARPPVGSLRFRAPERPERWSGVRPATGYGPAAPQVVNEALNSVLPSGEEVQSEDCLYLNVWTPGVDGAKRPVMVWIHGGAFTIGSGSSPMYSGQQLASLGDVVVVTINYRLGVLGFVCLQDDPIDGPITNFGMLDQVAALRWVRDEIAAFGGDPGNVTIFGESAGGMSVGALMGSPLAAGLFQRAIPQSGAGHNALALEKAAETAQRFASLAGAAAPTREALRDLTPAAILEAQALLEAETMAAMGAGRPPEMPFQPVIDGHFLKQLPIEAVRGGLSAGVSLLVGTTAEESRLFTAMVPPAEPRDDETVARAFAARLTHAGDLETGRDAVRVYRQAREARGEPATPDDLYVAADTDYMFAIPAHRLADAQASHQPRTFAYRFDWKSPMLGGVLGACHALEIPFVFANHTLPAVAAFAGTGALADRLSEDVSAAWLAFARHGDPSTAQLQWPAFSSSRSTMVLDAPCRVEERPHEAERQCWEGRR